MRVDLIGGLVAGEGGPVAIARPKERALLALLALNPGRIVSADRPIDGLWGEDPPRTAAKTLQTDVKNLRGRIAQAGAERDLLRTEPPGYVLAVDPAAVDVLRVEDLVDDGVRQLADGDAPRAVRLLSDALAIADRDPAALDAPGLDGVGFRFDETRRRARDARTDALLAAGRHHEVIGPLTELVEAEPQNERAWGQLMTALYRDGRRRDALLAYERARERLADEFGLDPGPALTALARRILDDELSQPDRPAGDDHRVMALVVTSDGRPPGELVDRVLAGGAWIERRSISTTSELVVLPDALAAAVVTRRLALLDPAVRVRGTAVATAARTEEILAADTVPATRQRVALDGDLDVLETGGWMRVQAGWVPESLDQPRPRRVPVALSRHLELAEGAVPSATAAARRLPQPRIARAVHPCSEKNATDASARSRAYQAGRRNESTR